MKTDNNQEKCVDQQEQLGKSVSNVNRKMMQTIA